MTETNPRRICLPAGFTPVGRKVRAWCMCGWCTTPRVNQDRALDALLSEHGWTAPICALCETDYRPHVPGRNGGFDGWLELRRLVEILTDPATGDKFLACAGMPQSCRDGAKQKQLQLDRDVADGFGIELPRPTLRLVRGGDAADRRDGSS
ncbi:hypothetical protein IU459_29535 [Nocardia amamiensis]|uniref:Uncharacterized protein n=1 Tax=Nocardia amamiensis TaxID=404578 RepID=A0ABS0CYH6_9NOCA|nr:hypothetical protein [Nocardia amamiensis]MBF6301651.1 hypothetical protein [Nocardia amamiensis]